MAWSNIVACAMHTAPLHGKKVSHGDTEARAIIAIILDSLRDFWVDPRSCVPQGFLTPDIRMDKMGEERGACMQDYRAETEVGGDGSLTLKGLPFRPGDRVEVVVRRHKAVGGNGDRYPLRGKPVRLINPFDPVAQEDWGGGNG